MPRLLLLAVLILAPAVRAQAPLPPIAELPGSLVIVGGGNLPASVRERFVALAGKDHAKIVVIPTASEFADDPKEDASFVDPWKKLGAKTVTLLHARDRKVADTEAFVAPLREATAVWFGGGDQAKVTAAYLGTRTETEIAKVLARGGVLGGTSAGAALMSSPMITGGKDVATFAAGFGFLPGFVTDQHFVARNRKARLVGILDKHPGYIGLGIDEGTAVVVRGRALEVVGNSTASLFLSAGAGKPNLETLLKAKDVADLFQLRRAAMNRAAKEPFPPKVPAAPVVAKGTLLIVGGGGVGPEIWKTFLEKAGGASAKIVFTPTAMEDPIDVEKVAEVRALKAAGATDIKVLHTRDRKTADDPAFSAMLTEATAVWFGGGRQWRLVDAYENTLAAKRIRAVLDRGGIIGGSSAGASIQSEFMPRGHPLGNAVMAAEGYERGFGYLPGCAVDQHFFARKRTADMTELMKLYPQYLGIGIDEGTAIVVTASTATVLGKGNVGFYDTAKPAVAGTDYETVAAGGTYDLKTRSVVK